MKKNFVFIILLISFLTLKVNAVSSNDRVGADLTEYSCSAFQEESKAITGDTYFGRCMEAQCDNSKWNLKYYENRTVTCKNGNLNPYTKITNDGCEDYKGNTCRNADPTKKTTKYCTTITYFDCNRTTNGSKYVAPTKPTKPTKPISGTTETTEAVKNNNTYLSSIELSTGRINFNKDTKDYSISVGSDISYITVNAKAEADTSKVSVAGNTNLVAGENRIVITVTAEDGSQGTYIILVNKEESVSKNTKLTSIKINGVQIDNFNSLTTNYIYKTKDKSIKVEVITEDSNAAFSISDTNNLKDGSTVKITVTAEDKKTTQDYIITIDAPSNSSIGIIIFVVILVALIGVGGYYFFTKQKNGGEKEYEYE